MIEVVEGFGVGAGKTYYVVTRLIEHFIGGGSAAVVDTMCIKWDAMKSFVERRYGLKLQDSQYRQVSEEEILTIHHHTPQGTPDCPFVIVVDECHGKLNARDWNDKNKRGLFDWATQSRHDDNDLWFISQSALNVDKQIRRIATFNWRIKNTDTFKNNIVGQLLKVSKWLSFGLHSGRYFIVSQLDADGKSVIGDRKWLEQEKDIFACYDSKAMRGKRKRSGEAVARLILEKKKEHVHPMIKVAFAILALMIGFAGFTYWKTKKKEKKQVVAVASASVEKGEAKAPPAGTPPAEYDIREETFRRTIEPRHIGTDGGDYYVGRMSKDGMVEAILADVIRVKQSNGRLLFITMKRALPDTRPHPEAAATPTPRPIIIAPDGTIDKKS